MYHIKEDKRSQTSAAQIAQGLQECLKTTPLKSITVTDIHRITGISRATFYRLFDTPEDVLIYQLDHMTESLMDYFAGETETPTAARLLEETIAMGLYHHVFIKALVENGRFDLLYQYTEKSFRMIDRYRSLIPDTLEPLEREYIISHLSMTMVASQVTWARNGRKESASDLLHHLRQYISLMQSLVEETE